ncbi:MAG TPA: glycine oxidase ThiO [Stellaceae bacterium]
MVGGGVIGLSIGWRLAAAGCPVDLYERGVAGRGATWAAAGMLAACVELEPTEEALLALDRLSQSMWPDFARELEAASDGIDVGYREEGTLVVALTRDDVEKLRFAWEMQRDAGIPLEWLSGAAARQREPYLNPRIAAALYSPQDRQVDNRQVAAALVAAFRRAGGRLHERAEVDAIDIAGGRAQGVVVAGERRAADIVVLAAGAWSAGVPGVPEAARPPVRPVKGQMLAVRMDRAAPLLRHVVWGPTGYLVPRRDGRLLVGATVEERGFDGTLTAGGLYTLLDAAWRVLPGIEELPIDETWTGFRPGSRDDAPYLGPTAIDGLVLATGHHRNGILLTPVTAAAIADFVLTGTVAQAIRPFAVDRIAAARRATPEETP